MLKAFYPHNRRRDRCRSLVATLSISEQVEARGSVPGMKADRADMRPLAGKCSENEFAERFHRLLRSCSLSAPTYFTT